MVEKQKRLEKEYEKEMIYATINEQDRIERETKEKLKKEEHLGKVKERNEALKKQIEEIQVKRVQEVEELKKEKDMLR